MNEIKHEKGFTEQPVNMAGCEHERLPLAPQCALGLCCYQQESTSVCTQSSFIPWRLAGWLCAWNQKTKYLSYHHFLSASQNPSREK